MICFKYFARKKSRQIPGKRQLSECEILLLEQPHFPSFWNILHAEKCNIFKFNLNSQSHSVSDLKKTAFSFWVEILGENMLEEPSNTFLSFLVKNEGNIFFHFLPYKTCKLGATGHGPRGLAGMKIMKIILCYCAQWCCSSWF